MLPALAARLMLGEAVAAVDRPVLAGLEGHARSAAAVGADGVVHLAGTAVAAAASISAAASAFGLPTGRAMLGVLVFTLRVVLLVVRAEDELLVTLHTGQVTVVVGHSMTSFLLPGLRSGHRSDTSCGRSRRRTLTSSTT